MTTKEQELKALEQIEKIINGLGEDSYVMKAFEGCTEIARSNIECDFFCSMQQQRDSAKEEAESLKQRVEALQERVASRELELEALKKSVINKSDLGNIAKIIADNICDLKNNRDNAAIEIVHYADDSNSNQFQSAVFKHRFTVKLIQQTAELLERVEEAMKN